MSETLRNPDSRFATVSRLTGRALPRVVGAVIAINLLPGCGSGNDKKDTTPVRDPNGLAFQTFGEGSDDRNLIVVPPKSWNTPSDDIPKNHKLRIRLSFDCKGSNEGDFVSLKVEGIGGEISANACGPQAGQDYIVQPDNPIYQTSIVGAEVTSSNPRAHWELSAQTGE